MNDISKYPEVPEEGRQISYRDGELVVPHTPVIPFIEGDGIGPDIWNATKEVLDSSVEKAYSGQRRIEWVQIYAAEKSMELFGQWVPDETVQAIRDFRVAIKGPLTTPVGEGSRSANVQLRQMLDLYACVRPVFWIPAVPSPMKHPEKLDVVVFRENTEDVYAGIEFRAASREAVKLQAFLHDEFGEDIRDGSGIGIKPVSEFGTKRLMRQALEYAIEHGRNSITIMHKGNIMKFTEGAFKNWCFELASGEYGDITVSEDELWEKHDGRLPAGKILVKDRIADAMFQQILLRPDEYELIITPNLNGDYISDAAAAQVGGLGLAP